jgi:hypothetical protein
MGAKGHMSAFILKKKVKHDSNEYTVIRQDEKLRNKRDAPGGYLKHGSFGGYQFYSDGCPAMGDEAIFLRGTSKDMDNNVIRVYRGEIDKFEKAVLLFNRKYGNNKDIDVEDVIWKEDQ